MSKAPLSSVWYLEPFYYKLNSENHLVLYRDDSKEWNLSSHDSLAYFLKEKGIKVLGKTDIRKSTIQLLISRFGITSKQANRMIDADVIKLNGCET
jgi:hypothetical protein